MAGEIFASVWMAVLQIRPVALTSRALVITGGPGVGKTTLVQSILLILRAKNFDLGDVRNQQQLRAHVLNVIAQLTMAEAISSKSVNQAIGVAEIIVEERSYDALGQDLDGYRTEFLDLVRKAANLSGVTISRR